jgi:hypothetical protein
VTHCTGTLLIVAAVLIAANRAYAQERRDSAKTNAASAAHPWRDSVRYGEGPSVGAPLSDYTGKAPPSKWCLQPTTRPPGDFGVTGANWTEASRSWLRDVLTDTSEFGQGWRKVLGGAPLLSPRDSIVHIVTENECHEIADIINREILGWSVGPPPVVVFRVRDYLIAYPSNARMGEFGLAVGMTTKHQIRGVATW